MTTAEAFKLLCDKLVVSDSVKSQVSIAEQGVMETLAKAFSRSFRQRSTDIQFKFVGSFGRNTACTSIRNFGLLAVFSDEVYLRYDLFQSGGQAQLLQDVKDAFKSHCAAIKRKGDGNEGQIVQLLYDDGVTLDLMPCFNNEDGSFSYPDTDNGGRWVVTNPRPEIEYLARADAAHPFVYDLCRIVRAWKDHVKVGMRCRLIDTLVCQFAQGYDAGSAGTAGSAGSAGSAGASGSGADYSYYPALCRDFFKFLSEQEPGRKSWNMVGSDAPIENPEDFRPAAHQAYLLACDAIKADEQNYQEARDNKWREIFGNVI